jgi:hypothetical protein
MSLTRDSWSNFASRIAGRRLILAGISLGYALVMLSLTTTTGLYGTSPYHRIQADALLHGHLWLGNTIDQLGPGLAWHNGHVQQVWGLGIGFWLLPFQAVWRLFGGQMFPDRLALGVAFALLAAFATSAGLRIAKNGQISVGLGFIWLVLFCPPLWTLARASQLVFEETVLYGILVCLGVLIGLVRVALFDSRADCMVICVLAVLLGLVRPTLAIYGLSAVLVVSLILFWRSRSRGLIALINLGFLAGLAFLAGTNWIRFGSPFEFGHRLTINTDSMVYLTRFGNPYAKTGTTDAAKELLGSLFLDSNVRDSGAYSENQFPWQSSGVRWRRLYMTLFDPIYAAICLAGAGGAAWWLVRRMKGKQAISELCQRPDNALIMALLLWSSISVAGLGLFYLRAPVIASRYLLDFLPGIVCFMVPAWGCLASRLPRVSLFVLGTWLLYELATAKVPIAQNTAHSPDIALPRSSGASLASFGGNYSLDHSPGQSGITFNGHGWDSEGGFAGDLVTLAVDNPQFIELHLSNRREFNGVPARKDVYQARMDGQALSLRSVMPESDGLTVTFDVPAKLQHGQQMVFLCFSAGYDSEDRDSERFLYSVKWK